MESLEDVHRQKIPLGIQPQQVTYSMPRRRIIPLGENAEHGVLGKMGGDGEEGGGLARGWFSDRDNLLSTISRSFLHLQIFYYIPCFRNCFFR